jgi:AraC-like DNA-binding protein
MKPVQEVIYRRDPQLCGVEICEVIQSRHVFPDHAHNGIYAIGMMAAGGAYCLGPEKSYSLVSPGQIALINPNQVHSGVPVAGKRISYCMIYVDQHAMTTDAAEVSRRPGANPEFSSIVVSDPVLWRRLQRLARLIPGPGSRLEKESAIMAALAHLVSFYGNVRSKPRSTKSPAKSIQQAKAFLSENLDQKLSLADVAGAAGLSRYHFLRVFKRETGLSPHLFRTLRRIDRAKQLLRGGLAPAHTALSVGFSDQSHFTNTFRRFTGATPGQYFARSSPSSRFVKHPPAKPA